MLGVSMNRQFDVFVDGKRQGQFTILCERSKHGLGWTARAKYRSQYGGWSLDRTPAFVSKADAIKTAQEYMEADARVDGYTLSPVAKAQWLAV